MARMQEKMERVRGRMERYRSRSGWFGSSSSGNRAFDDYRQETLKRLEDEQREFKEFLERLRFAKDRGEFDQFMADRRQRPFEEGGEPPPAEPRRRPSFRHALPASARVTARVARSPTGGPFLFGAARSFRGRGGCQWRGGAGGAAR